eukprot:SAG31_NODE_25203_length_466_cov_0.705722_1_plen_57_part_01
MYARLELINSYGSGYRARDRRADALAVRAKRWPAYDRRQVSQTSQISRISQIYFSDF